MLETNTPVAFLPRDTKRHRQSHILVSGGLVLIMYRSTETFVAFSFHFPDPDVRKKALNLLGDTAVGNWGNKSAAVFASLLEIQEGFFVCWKTPARWTAARAWLIRMLGEMALHLDSGA